MGLIHCTCITYQERCTIPFMTGMRYWTRPVGRFCIITRFLVSAAIWAIYVTCVAYLTVRMTMNLYLDGHLYRYHIYLHIVYALNSTIYVARPGRWFGMQQNYSHLMKLPVCGTINQAERCNHHHWWCPCDRECLLRRIVQFGQRRVEGSWGSELPISDGVFVYFIYSDSLCKYTSRVLDYFIIKLNMIYF